MKGAIKSASPSNLYHPRTMTGTRSSNRPTVHAPASDWIVHPKGCSKFAKCRHRLRKWIDAGNTLCGRVFPNRRSGNRGLGGRTLNHAVLYANCRRSPIITLFMHPRIGILVVAYNAESTLRHVLARIPASIKSKIEEVFVFDDASQDNTHQVGIEAQKDWDGKKLTILRNPVNLMYGGNQKRGYQYAIERGLDIVVLLHGDGQYAPEVMQRLLG